MRRILFFLKAVAVTAACALCILFVYALYFSPVFSKAERYEFYTGTSSEKMLSSRSPFAKLTLPSVSGESAFYTGDRVEEIRKAFQAELLFTEEAGGTINYYCYSPMLKGSAYLNGYSVNLHLAYNGSTTAAGTPVIFGGY